jgi:hypothetical protein
MSEENINGREESKPSVSFIEQIIIDDLKEGKTRESSYQVFPNLMVTPYRSCKSYLFPISVCKRSMVVNVIFASMIQIR